MKRNKYRMYKEISLQLLGNKCSKCGSTTRLEIDHKDGNPTDNHIDNIHLLCKGCHIKKHIRAFELFKYKKKLKLRKEKKYLNINIKCECGEEIKGSTEDHAKALLKQHKQGKHHKQIMKAIENARDKTIFKKQRIV